jgi:hypothetical protein
MFSGPVVTLSTIAQGYAPMFAALKPSQRIAVMGFIAPQSATTVKTTAWVDASTFENFMAIIQTGVITATGLVDATIQQATSVGGAGAKALTTALAITELVATTNNNQQAIINFKQDDLDVTNGFRWIQLSITPSVAAGLIAGVLLGCDPRYAPADALAPTSQVQIVGP